MSGTVPIGEDFTSIGGYYTNSVMAGQEVTESKDNYYLQYSTNMFDLYHISSPNSVILTEMLTPGAIAAREDMYDFPHLTVLLREVSNYFRSYIQVISLMPEFGDVVIFSMWDFVLFSRSFCLTHRVTFLNSIKARFLIVAYMRAMMLCRQSVVARNTDGVDVYDKTNVTLWTAFIKFPETPSGPMRVIDVTDMAIYSSNTSMFRTGAQWNDSIDNAIGGWDPTYIDFKDSYLTNTDTGRQFKFARAVPGLRANYEQMAYIDLSAQNVKNVVYGQRYGLYVIDYIPDDNAKIVRYMMAFYRLFLFTVGPSYASYKGVNLMEVHPFQSHKVSRVGKNLVFIFGRSTVIGNASDVQTVSSRHLKYISGVSEPVINGIRVDRLAYSLGFVFCTLAMKSQMNGNDRSLYSNAPGDGLPMLYEQSGSNILEVSTIEDFHRPKVDYRNLVVYCNAVESDPHILNPERRRDLVALCAQFPART